MGFEKCRKERDIKRRRKEIKRKKLVNVRRENRKKFK
jgi:hypothetical protein